MNQVLLLSQLYRNCREIRRHLSGPTLKSKRRRGEFTGPGSELGSDLGSGLAGIAMRRAALANRTIPHASEQ
jgi:hypothetical protein